MKVRFDEAEEVNVIKREDNVGEPAAIEYKS